MGRFASDFSLEGRPYRGWWLVKDRLISYVVHILPVSAFKRFKYILLLFGFPLRYDVLCYVIDLRLLRNSIHFFIKPTKLIRRHRTSLALTPSFRPSPASMLRVTC